MTTCFYIYAFRKSIRLVKSAALALSVVVSELILALKISECARRLMACIQTLESCLVIGKEVYPHIMEVIAARNLNAVLSSERNMYDLVATHGNVLAVYNEAHIILGEREEELIEQWIMAIWHQEEDPFFPEFSVFSPAYLYYDIDWDCDHVLYAKYERIS